LLVEVLAVDESDGVTELECDFDCVTDSDADGVGISVIDGVTVTEED